MADLAARETRPAASVAGPLATGDLVFVGGTGRSGTHVISSLLERHSRFARVPIEARFHCNPKGLADLVGGRTTKREFLRKMRRFWWRRIRAGERAPTVLRTMPLGRKVRGLHKIVERDEFDRALARFDAAFDNDQIGASRELFCELLWPTAAQAGKPALVEMSCFTVAAAPDLVRIFPEARFVHAVRDGRDAGSSKVGKRQKREHPRDAFEGLRWWEGRLANIESAVRGVEPGIVEAISLDELVGGDRDAELARLLGFAGIDEEPALRAFFEQEMSADAAHAERWRAGLDDDQQARLTALYEEALARLEDEGYHCAPALRRAFGSGA